MGRLTALSLKRKGYQVSLFDKDEKNAKQSAAYAAAGLLTPLGESQHAEPNIVAMGFESLKLWPSLLETLEQYHFFQQEGAIMVSHEQDQGDYQRFYRFVKQHFPQHQIQQLNRQQLLELEPELGRSFYHGLFLPDEGQIGNRKLLVALEWQLHKEGVEWFDSTEVTAITPTSSGCSITHERGCQAFDLVVDCRGLGAQFNGKNERVKPIQGLRGVRGEIFQLLAPDVHITRPIRLMHPRYQLYIAPKGKGFYVVGATEIESEDASPMTVRSALELLSAAYSVHPGFAEANIRQHLSQLRPAFDDNQPKIQVSDSLIQVNGLYRHGFLIAPVVLKQIEKVVMTQLEPTCPDLLHCYDEHLPIRFN